MTKSTTNTQQTKRDLRTTFANYVQQYTHRTASGLTQIEGPALETADGLL